MGPAKTIKKVGDYTVASCIGKGRYGVCFLAFDPDGNKVILKRFRPRMWRKNRHANHYEAVILSGLEHPAVPELLGVINNQKGYYFVLEYKDGFTLEQWLFEKKKVFTAEEIYRIGSQIFEVLEYLHSVVPQRGARRHQCGKMCSCICCIPDTGEKETGSGMRSCHFPESRKSS